jgi:hypothetical protein
MNESHYMGDLDCQADRSASAGERARGRGDKLAIEARKLKVILGHENDMFVVEDRRNASYLVTACDPL